MRTFYAVFDTNVLVSALMSKHADSPTVLLLDYVLDGRIVLLYNQDIIKNEMKKIIFLMMLVAAATTIKAQNNNATLLQPAGSYIYYGDQAFNLKQCVDFLSTRHQPAYKTFQSGYKCYQAGWGLFGAGLGMDLIGSLIIAFGPEEGNAAMLYSGMTCLGLGAAAVLASVPTIFIGYTRLNDGIDMFNHTQSAATSQAYWSIQGSQNGIGLALHF